jgi:F0F1-type ATP synthase membrane subunit c/vacuolar-type H+-ATPase subunit K
MPYAPTVNDRSGEILGNAQANAAQIRAQGMIAMGEGIGDGLAAIGSGLSQGMTKAAQNKMTSEYLDQMAHQFTQTPGMDGETPLMSQDELDKFSKMSLGAKQGMIVPKQAEYDQALKNSYYDSQLKLWGAKYGIQNQVPQNQQPYTGTPAATPTAAQAQPQANPAGSINMNFVK